MVEKGEDGGWGETVTAVGNWLHTGGLIKQINILRKEPGFSLSENEVTYEKGEDRKPRKYTDINQQ